MEDKEAGPESPDSPSLFLHKVGGFRLNSHRPVISSNKKHLYVISRLNIRKYSLDNGNFLDEYTFGNKSPVVAVQESVDTADELVIAFEDGMIVVWNVEENMKTAESYLKLTQEDSTVTFFQQVGSCYYFVIRKRTKEKSVSQLFYCWKNQVNQVMMMNQFDHVNNDAHRAVVFGGEHCAVIYKHILYIYEIPVKVGSKNRSHLVNQDKCFTCVAFHPTEPIIATGDNLGQIIIWNSFHTSSPSRSVLHWHSRSVADLTYSPSGTFLYSVGAEMVLVKWNLVGKHFGEKNFLPRLGAPIRYVVVDTDHQMIITSHEDQCLQIIDTQFNGIRTVIEGLSVGSGFEGKLSAGLHYNSKLNAIAMNGRTGHVQFYCPVRQKQLFQLDIVQQNLIPAVNSAARIEDRLKQLKTKQQNIFNKIYPIEVSRIASSPDGCWLATVEYRNDHETLPEIRLKFWLNKSENKNNFGLNTTIHLPHQEEILFVAFSQRSTPEETLHLVTTSKDSYFKIWDLQEKDREKIWWTCSRNASLNNLAIPSMAAFSSDASLITVLFDNRITLWEVDPHTTNIRYIPRSDAQWNSPRVIFLQFATGNYSHYLIEGRSKSVLVSDVTGNFRKILNYRVEGEVNISSIVLNPYENLLALLLADRIEFLSLRERKVLMKVDFGRHRHLAGTIRAAVFTPEPNDSNERTLRDSSFYCVTDRCEMYKAIQLTGEQELFEDNENVILVGAERQRKTELFMKRVYGQVNPLPLLLSGTLPNSTKSATESKQVQSVQDRKSLVEKFFYNVPAHVLPSVGVLAMPYLSLTFESMAGTMPTTTAAAVTDDTRKRIQFDDNYSLPPKQQEEEEGNHHCPSDYNQNELMTFLDRNTDNGDAAKDGDVANYGDDHKEDNVDEEGQFWWLAKFLKADNATRINTPHA